MYIYTAHPAQPHHLADVINEMKVLGAPTIRVVDCGDHFIALDGTHRLAAACELGVAPDLDILDQDDIVDASSLDWPELTDGEYTAGELAADRYHSGSGCYKLENDGLLTLVYAAN